MTQLRRSPHRDKQTPGVPRRSVERPVLHYLDVGAPLLAAPIVLALGAPAVGYGLGAAGWIVVRALGVVAARRVGSAPNVAQQAWLRLAYRFARASVVIAITVLAFKGEGLADGTTALLVITFAFTTRLSLSIIHRPRRLHEPGRRVASQALRQSRMARSPIAAGMTAKSTPHRRAATNGGASVAEPAASCPASTAGNRQLDGHRRRVRTPSSADVPDRSG